MWPQDGDQQGRLTSRCWPRSWPGSRSRLSRVTKQPAGPQQRDKGRLQLGSKDRPG